MLAFNRATKFSRVRPADLRKAREGLKKAVEAISDDGFQVENPVTRARGQIKLEQHATPEQKVILDKVKAIQERLEDLETKYIRERVRTGMPSTAIQSEILTTMYVHLHETVTNRKVVQDVMQTINEIFLQTIFTIQDKVISFELTNKDLRSPVWAQTKERLTRISGVKEVSEFPF